MSEWAQMRVGDGVDAQLHAIDATARTPERG